MLMPGVDPVDSVLASGYRDVCDWLPSLDLNPISGLVSQLDLRPDLSLWTCLTILTLSWTYHPQAWPSWNTQVIMELGPGWQTPQFTSHVILPAFSSLWQLLILNYHWFNLLKAEGLLTYEDLKIRQFFSFFFFTTVLKIITWAFQRSITDTCLFYCTLRESNFLVVTTAACLY